MGLRILLLYIKRNIVIYKLQLNDTLKLIYVGYKLFSKSRSVE